MPSGTKYFFTLFLILVLSFSSSAQYRSRYKRSSNFWDGFKIEPLIGVNLFYGDLVDNIDKKNLSGTSISGGIVFNKDINTYLTGRLQFMGGSMKGTKEEPASHYNAEFKNKYAEGSIGLSFRFLDLFAGYFRQRQFNPYIFAQFGGIYSNAHRWGDYKYPSGVMDTIIKKVTPVIPLGIGTTFWLTPRISLVAEASGDFLLGDEVDGFKFWYNGNGEKIDTESNDFYYTFTIGITYLINDSRWKNDPKYNRKAYLKTRSLHKRSKSSYKKRKSYKHKSRR